MSSTRFEVGKKYQSCTANIVYTCLFVNEEGVLLQKKGAPPSFWLNEHTEHHLREYTPPPKKVKKTGWMNIYEGPTNFYGSVFSTKEGAIIHRSDARKHKETVEVTWEEEVPEDENEV